MYNVKNKKWVEYPRTIEGFCKAIKNRRLEDKIAQYFKSTDCSDILLLFYFNRFKQVYLFTESYLETTGVKYFDETINSIETYITGMNKTLYVYNEVIEDLIKLDDLTSTSTLVSFIKSACKSQCNKMITVASLKYNTELIYEEGELKLWHIN